MLADLVFVEYHRKYCHRWQYYVVLYGESGIVVNVDRKTGVGDGSGHKAIQTEIPDRLNGSSRIRVPVAAKIAFVMAGVAGAIGGSPRPVGELSLWMK